MCQGVSTRTRTCRCRWGRQGRKEARWGVKKRPYLLQKSQGRGLPQARGRARDEGRDVAKRHVLRAVCGLVCGLCLWEAGRMREFRSWAMTVGDDSDASNGNHNRATVAGSRAGRHTLNSNST